MSTESKEKIDPSIVAAARRRAAEIAQQDPGFARGAEDLKKLGRAAGMPAARIALGHLIEAGGAPALLKERLKKQVDEIAMIKLTGCLTVDFENTKTHKKDVMYPLLGECPSPHPLGKELDPLKGQVGEGKWPVVLRHLSVLVALGRGVYHSVVQENKELVDEIVGYLSDSQKEEYGHGMLVDPVDTTLYVLKGHPRRVGIFIKSMPGLLG